MTSHGLALFAHRIDEQLCDVLVSQFASALEEVDGGLSERFKPEIRLIVLAVFYSMALLTADANHGDKGGRSLGAQLNFGANSPGGGGGVGNTRSLGSYTNKDGTKTTIKIVGSSVTPIAAGRQSVHSAGGKDCLHMSTPGMQVNVAMLMFGRLLFYCIAVLPQALGMHSQSTPLVDAAVQILRSIKHATFSPTKLPPLQRRTYQLGAVVAYLLSTYALERAQRQDLLQGWAAAAPGTWRYRLHRLVRLADAVAKVRRVLFPPQCIRHTLTLVMPS